MSAGELIWEDISGREDDVSRITDGWAQGKDWSGKPGIAQAVRTGSLQSGVLWENTKKHGCCGTL